MIYLTNTRLDIVHIVSIVSKFISEPSKAHFFLAKRILRYAKGTKTFSILYELNHDSNLVGYFDSDCVDNVDDHKSTSGYVFLRESKAISWALKKRKIVALLSIEAKYIAGTSLATEVVWLRRILQDF